MASTARKDVSFQVGTTWAVMKGEMIAGKFSDPGLVTIEFLGFTEVFKVLVVCPNLKWDRGSHEKMTPLCESSHDCKELTIINLVILFCR